MNNINQLSWIQKSNSVKDELKVIELFAGAGGLSLGLERAGFKPIALIEIDKDACQTLRINRPNWNIIEDDISNITNKNLQEYFNLKPGELDLLSGGAPCQAFSYAGKRLGFKDTRGTLFYHYALFLKQLKPKAFLFENVRGLKSHDHGRTYETILNTFKECGYKVQSQILNAWDYGVAQKRERLIIIGVQKELDINISFPQKDPNKLVLSDILKDVPDSAYVKYSKTKEELFKKIPPGGCWIDLPTDLAKAYMKSSYNSGGGKRGILRRLKYSEPSLTVLTSPTQKQTERCHPEFERPFTIRENARIQSFPDEWKFSGSVNSQYKQIGNAVPVELAYRISKEIYNSLRNYYLSLRAVKIV